MTEQQTTHPDDIPAGALRDIPADLRRALMQWWRAHHHGSAREEEDAAETLCAAISPRIAGFRELEYGKQS